MKKIRSILQYFPVASERARLESNFSKTDCLRSSPALALTIDK